MQNDIKFTMLLSSDFLPKDDFSLMYCKSGQTIRTHKLVLGEPFEDMQLDQHTISMLKYS